MISTPIYSPCWAEYQRCYSHFSFHWPPSCHMPSIHVWDAPVYWAFSRVLQTSAQMSTSGLSWWLSGKESTCQCRRHGFDPRSRKIPHACRATLLRGHNHGACAPGPGRHNHRTLKALEPGSATRETTAVRIPSTAAREQPPVTTATEKPAPQ